MSAMDFCVRSDLGATNRRYPFLGFWCFAITYKMQLQRPTFFVCNFLHLYFTINKLKRKRAQLHPENLISSQRNAWSDEPEFAHFLLLIMKLNGMLYNPSNYFALTHNGILQILTPASAFHCTSNQAGLSTCLITFFLNSAPRRHIFTHHLFWFYQNHNHQMHLLSIHLMYIVLFPKHLVYHLKEKQVQQ